MGIVDIYYGSCFDMGSANNDGALWCNCSAIGEGHCMPGADVVTCQITCNDCDKTNDYLKLAKHVDCTNPRPPDDPVMPDPVMYNVTINKS